jgi:hypothetical protein
MATDPQTDDTGNGAPATPPGERTRRRRDRLFGALIALGAGLIAAVSARPYAGANDGSRLAAVESLADRGTLAIDDSIFVRPPPPGSPLHQRPYRPDSYGLPAYGTSDKVRIHGRFYSDKPPTQAVLMAGVYALLKSVGVLDARQRTDRFCYAMTLASSGLGYTIAVVFAYRLGRTLGLQPGWSAVLSGVLGLATTALPYTRHVNSHIVLLGVGMGLFERLSALARRSAAPTSIALFVIGTLVGLAYALEQVPGLLMIAGTFVILFLRWPRLRTVGLALAGAMPWLLLHHALTYHIAGTIGPANSVPEYFAYPGSQFDRSNMTGVWHHETLAAFGEYAANLLVGDRGFVQANLPMLLAIVAAPFVVRRLPALRLEILFALGLSVGTWLAYAALSNNYSGWCCSIRWFVPLLAPGFFVLALVLREYPRRRVDCVVLAAYGAVLATLMWWDGPWDSDTPGYWPITGAALVTWLVVAVFSRVADYRAGTSSRGTESA